MDGWEWNARRMIQTYVELCKQHLQTIRSVVDREAMIEPREVRCGEETHDVVSSKGITPFSLARRSKHLEVLLRAIDELDQTLEGLKVPGTAGGFMDMCAECKKIRDPHGEWIRIEEYIASCMGADISHGLCPQCIQKLYPEYEPP